MNVKMNELIRRVNESMNEMKTNNVSEANILESERLKILWQLLVDGILKPSEGFCNVLSYIGPHLLNHL